MSSDPVRSADDYADAWLKLLPRGRAWPREVQSNLLRFLQGQSGIWGRVDERAHKLRDLEVLPETADELLIDWERVLQLPEPRHEPAAFDENGERVLFPYFVPNGGFPEIAGQAETGADPFDDPEAFGRLMDEMLMKLGIVLPEAGPELTIEERQARATQKLTARGGASREYFIEIARGFGWPDASITEYSPVECGITECGHPYWECASPLVRYHWSMYIGAVPVDYAQCGLIESGKDPQATIQQDYELEALIQRRKPAHTIVNFFYSELIP